MPAASAPVAGAGGAGAAPAEEVEKPKEKTIFTVKLEKFEATAKAKIIREVKAIMPNMNLVEVCPSFTVSRWDECGRLSADNPRRQRSLSNRYRRL